MEMPKDTQAMSKECHVWDVSRSQAESGLNPTILPTILWKGGSPEKLVLNIRLGDEYVKAQTILQQLAAAELPALLGLLFPQARQLLVEPMGRGFSHTGILKVQPFYGGGGQQMVIKFGDPQIIEREYCNYMQYVQHFVGDTRCTSVLNYRQTDHLGGIVYSFVGTSIQQTQEFGTFYQTASFAQIKRTLHNLFFRTCAIWYANRETLQPLDLTAEYLGSSDTALQEYSELLAGHPSSVTRRSELTFKMLKTMPGRTFTNPLQVLQDIQPLICPTYTCTIHKDLNHHNILVDHSGHSWLIDFQYTGPGHILRDIATLDCALRIQLLDPHQISLDERLLLEEALFTRQRSALQSCSSENRAALTRMYDTICYLRTLTRHIVTRHPTSEIKEYTIALLYTALQCLDFSLTEVQLAHAVLSASLLVDVLKQTP